MKNSPVAISGTGSYSCFGFGTQKLWDSYLNPENKFTNNTSTGCFEIALAAAKESLESAQLLYFPSHAKFVLGTNVGNVNALSKLPSKDIAGFLSPNSLPSWANHQLLSERLKNELGFKQKASTLTGACASGALAIGYAFDLISTGTAEIVLVGGADVNTSFKKSGHNLIKSASPSGKVKPFDINRDGTVFSDGAGFMVLESINHCLKRNHKPLAVLSGYGVGTDIDSLTAPDANGVGAKIAIKSALKNANLSPDCIDHIQAHGTGTELNDKIEAKVIKQIFGNQLQNMTVSADKGALGHTFGASGILSVILVTEMIKNKLVLPISGCEQPDHECQIPLVIGKPKKKKITSSLCNNFGFGGCNVSIAVQCWEG